MSIGPAIVREAESWIGTAFQWQAQLKGVACDCKGLVAGAARACGRAEAYSIEAIAGDYGEAIDPARLRAGLGRLFDRVPVGCQGDIALIRVAGKAQHLAIVTARASDGGFRTIEALSRGPRCVSRYRRRPDEVDSIWRWRDVETASG